ncbi:MAG: hypothetical protein ACXVXC_06805 [Nocardioidaceae bacterium]
MDAATVTVSLLGGLVAGGAVGGLVSAQVARIASRDRGEAIAFEREKWRETLRQERHRGLEDLYRRTTDALGGMDDALNSQRWRSDGTERPLDLAEHVDRLGGLRHEWRAKEFPQMASSLLAVMDRAENAAAWDAVAKSPFWSADTGVAHESLHAAILAAGETLEHVYNSG